MRSVNCEELEIVIAVQEGCEVPYAIRLSSSISSKVATAVRTEHSSCLVPLKQCASDVGVD